MAASAFDVGALTQAGRAAGFKLPDGWAPIPERIPSSLDDYELSTQQTVERMAQHIHEAQTDQLIQSIASQAAGKWGIGPGRERRCSWDTFWFCKHQVRFLVDEAAVAALFGEQDQVDFLVSPSVLMRMPKPSGDCDDFTMLACSLLEANGIPWEIVTIAADRSQPGRWSHVYLRAVCPDGKRVTLDPTNGHWPGWEVPAVDIQRKQVWDQSGKRIADAAPERARMHAYIRGLGQGDEYSVGGSVGSSEFASSPSIFDSSSPFYVDPTTGYLDPGGIAGGNAAAAGSWTTPSASGSPSWLTSLISTVGSIGTKLGTLALLPTGGTMTTLPNGTQVFTNQAAAPAIGTLGGGSFSLSNIVLIAGIGLAAIFLLKAVDR